ncbi:hypothetical protein [Curtobacterium sp. BRD11]|uniref:hypothetical protein n=1 Tax=Curtobacterium sp. BRD11 TaxID=2962581 RepID=UPI00288251F5|nr:hypothetical protein [Curtobacterium sp. BRD11]MDT0211381.1 hypothetical protein [Curtobacterium sp. BRD11]
MRRPSRLLSATVAGLVVLGVATACSSAPVSGLLADDADATRAAGLDRWGDAMNAALLDGDRGFGSSNGLDRGAAGTETPAGDWDLLVACNGVDGKRLRVSVGPGGRDEVLRTDVPCGLVTRVPVTVPRGGGLTVEVEPQSDASDAVRHGDVVSYWYVSIVHRGFEPEATVVVD